VFEKYQPETDSNTGFVGLGCVRGSLTTLPTWVNYGGSASLLNGANNVFDGINQTGDIVSPDQPSHGGLG
jgi:hypothetical protein